MAGKKLTRRLFLTTKELYVLMTIADNPLISGVEITKTKTPDLRRSLYRALEMLWGHGLIHAGEMYSPGGDGRVQRQPFIASDLGKKLLQEHLEDLGFG